MKPVAGRGEKPCSDDAFVAINGVSQRRPTVLVQTLARRRSGGSATPPYI